jgi:hypothetical protein
MAKEMKKSFVKLNKKVYEKHFFLKLFGKKEAVIRFFWIYRMFCFEKCVTDLNKFQCESEKLRE